MAAVQPRVAPRRHPPPVAVPPLPTAPSEAPAARPQLLPCKRSRADAVGAVAHGRKERVAESCCPSSRLELVLVDDDSGEEDDGCGSSVEGGDGGAGDRHDEEEESGSRGVALWTQDSGSRGRRCSLWANGSRATTEGGQLRAGGERDDEDPTVVAAARRQEEDRKFWEACLASGYP